MLKKFSVLLLLLVIMTGISIAQPPPPPTLGQGETWTNLWSVSYDYQTNGSVRYLVQDPADPANWCAILMAQQDSTTPAGTGRYIYFSYSDDYGNTWSPNVLDASVPYGFPCMTLRNGIPVIAAHKSALLGTFVFQDLLFGGFAFQQLPGIPVPAAPPIWPHIAGTTNGNLVLVGDPNPPTVGKRSTYNGSSWSPFVDLPLINGPSGNFDVAAGPVGRVSIIGQDNAGSGALAWYQSIDNGNTFDNGNVILPFIIDGGDTLFANITGGFQAVYDNLGVAHIVFAAYNINGNAVFADPNAIAYVKPRIYHWTSAGGPPKRIAGRENIPALTDTVVQALNPPLTQPTITRTASGKLVCAFTTYLRGNTQVVDDGSIVNAGEIFATASSDNGATWGSPVNLTNTPNVEEKHSSLTPATSTDSVRIYYIRDLKAGGWVNISSWGKAPVYGIFKKAPPLPTVGIKENVSQAKTYELFQNYPNPFNPSTTISYYIQKTGPVTLKIFDITGREIIQLVNSIQSQGPKEITFDGSNFASGIYYYSITAGDFKDTKKMMLIK